MAYALNNEEFAIRQYLAGEALTAGNAVFVHTDGTVKKAVATVGTANVCVGVVIFDADSGAAVDVISKGIVSGFSGLTIGSPVYLSDATAGAVTSTVPKTYGDRVQVIGHALAANQIAIDVQLPGTINTEISASSGEAFDAGATLKLHTDGKLYKALATVGTADHCIGFAKTAATAADQEIQVQEDGIVTAGSGLTIGGECYLCEGATAGGVTQTPPSTAGDIVQGLGIAKTATTIAVRIGAPLVAKTSVS